MCAVKKACGLRSLRTDRAAASGKDVVPSVTHRNTLEPTQIEVGTETLVKKTARAEGKALLPRVRCSAHAHVSQSSEAWPVWFQDNPEALEVTQQQGFPCQRGQLCRLLSVIYLAGALTVPGTLRVRMRTRFSSVTTGLRRPRGFGDLCWGKGARILPLVPGPAHENTTVLVGTCSLHCRHPKSRARSSLQMPGHIHHAGKRSSKTRSVPFVKLGRGQKGQTP